MKALEIMKTSQSVNERAEEFAKSIKRNIQVGVLDVIVAKIEALKDKEFELKNFTLSTDMNAGVAQMSRQECENRFKELINISFEKRMLEVELTEKQKAFDFYFSEVPSEKAA